MKPVNLIPARRLQQKSRTLRLKKWGVALAVYGVVLAAAYAVCLACGGNDSDAIVRQMSQTTDYFRRASKEIHTLRTALSKASSQMTAARELAQNPHWSLLLEMVSRDLTDDVVLDRCALSPADPDAGQENEKPATGRAASRHATRKAAPSQVIYQRYLLDLSGFARAQTSVSQFVLRLENSRVFDSVRLIKTQKKEFMTGQAISFRIECTIGGKGGPSG